MPEDRVSQPKGQVQLTDQVNQLTDQANRLTDQVSQLIDRISQRPDRLHRTRHILRQTATVSLVQVQNMLDLRETTITRLQDLTRLQDQLTPLEAIPALREAAVASTLAHAAAALEAAVAV